MRSHTPQTRWTGRFGWLCVAGTLGCSPTLPQSPRAPKDAVVRVASDGVGDRSPCADQVREELVRGQRHDGCEDVRKRMTRALGKVAKTQTFGVVEQTSVNAVGIRLVLSRATRCGAWPLATGGRSWLRPTDAKAAGCRLRRYTGPLAIHVLRDDGRSLPLFTKRTDENGTIELSFATVDAALWAWGHPTGLDAFSVLLLGSQGWAGVVDLKRLRALWADRSARAVVAGRGSPRLFALRHPEHPAARTARALSLEAALARQERDYLAVVAGRLQPWVFLRRYPWSPYRRAVVALGSKSHR